jgi:hypothetical protein
VKTTDVGVEADVEAIRAVVAAYVAANDEIDIEEILRRSRSSCSGQLS